MSTSRFDDFARTVATPMSRRQTLRAAAGLALAAFLPALRPSLAAGAGEQDCAGRNELCPTPGSTNCGHSIPGQVGACCCYCCASKDQCMCAGGRCFCCEVKCGDKCCVKGEVCYHGQCLPDCPHNTVRCGNVCCTSKQRCRNGKCCDKCGGNGACCNHATEFCCREPGDPKSHGRCCKKGKESCCGVGPPDAQKRMCCPKPNKCTRQLPSRPGGLTESSPWVCCPPERQVPVDEAHPNDINACCAPGQVSLGGKLEVGQGIQGACCDENRICGAGSGADRVCCQTGQSCIGGTCA